MRRGRREGLTRLMRVFFEDDWMSDRGQSRSVEEWMYY